MTRTPLIRVRCLAVISCLTLGFLSGCAPPAPPGTFSERHPCTANEVGDDAASRGSVYVGPTGSGMSCALLTVPLDYGLFPGPRSSDQLLLPVAMSDNPAPRGVLVWLVGGPGSPGAAMAAEIAGQFDPAVLREYRLVLMSGRGTGPSALDCPGLQDELGGSDLAVPTAKSVQACAETIGPERALYSSSSSVEDLETLRHALGVPSLTLVGASYGTYLAERYALTHPDRVNRLLLDSVVPHDGADYFTNVEVIRQAVTLFRQACAQSSCAGDPVADLARLVRQDRDGPELLTLVAETDPNRFTALAGVLHDAATGHPEKLAGLLADAPRQHRTPARDLSQGLHTSVQCQDLPAPWGGADAPVAGREAAARAAIDRIDPAALYPFDASSVLGSGPMLTCQWWPPTPVAPAPARTVLPAVPTLLLAGDQDLSTPPTWTRHEAELAAPGAQVVVIPGSGHITQDVANPPGGRAAAIQFLLAGGR